MKTVKISLNSIDKVKSFVNEITKFDYDFDLVSGRYVIHTNDTTWSYSTEQSSCCSSFFISSCLSAFTKYGLRGFHCFFHHFLNFLLQLHF